MRTLLCGLLVVGVLGGTPAPGTAAYYSTGVLSSANQFSAGTVHISDSVAAGTTLSMGDLLAGDDFDAQLDISNSGSLALVYSATSLVSGDSGLATALQLTVRAKSTQPCSARDGSVLYTGSLASAALGDPTHGVQPGDRSLTHGTSESLCFTVALPTTVTSTVAGKSVSATFTFDAEQG